MLSTPSPMAYFSSRSTPGSLSTPASTSAHRRTLAAMSRAPRRRAVAGLAAVATSVALAGCNGGNISRRELVVHFDTSATAADHDAARTACATAAPHASPEPAPSASSRGVQPVNDVRFRVDHASDRDLNVLLQCLRRQRGVVGFDLPGADG